MGNSITYTIKKIYVEGANKKFIEYFKMKKGELENELVDISQIEIIKKYLEHFNDSTYKDKPYTFINELEEKTTPYNEMSSEQLVNKKVELITEINYLEKEIEKLNSKNIKELFTFD